MNESLRYIRFDWAIKRILRDKANFAVLEGLMTVLLNEKVTIAELLESEGNQKYADDKFNRVDVKAKNSKGEIIIVEIQLTREVYFLERILYGVAKALTEHIHIGDRYNEVKKVYSINIVYFDLGKGTDYLYHGQNHFVGVHTKDELKVSTRENNVIRMKTPKEIFPEYFILRVNEFDKVATTPLEEWMDYLKNGHIKDETETPGLNEAREKLQYMMMSRDDQIAYERHLDNIMIQNDVLDTAKMEGLAEGLAEGRAEGRAEGLEAGRAEGLEAGRAEGLEAGRAEGRVEGMKEQSLTIARKMRESGLSVDQILSLTGLSESDILHL